MKYIIAALLFTSSVAHADNIAFGVLKAIKVYDQSANKVTKLYFSNDATYQNIPGCDLVANITHSQHSEEAINQFVSIALSAYASGKKVRAYSSNNTCEIDFLALQESYF